MADTPGHRQITEAQAAQIAAIKEAGDGLMDALNKLHQNREVALAKTNLEQSIMWATKGIVG